MCPEWTWKTHVEAISEWPIDAAAPGRTGAFVLLPVASWVAVTQMFVDGRKTTRKVRTDAGFRSTAGT